MARSIHTTRRTLADHEAADQADRAAHRAETARLRDELARKRLIKAQVAAARGPAVPAEAPLDPAAITIVVKDHGPYVHHAVTAADVRGVIARLPPGAADGLGAIVATRDGYAPPRKPPLGSLDTFRRVPDAFDDEDEGCRQGGGRRRGARGGGLQLEQNPARARSSSASAPRCRPSGTAPTRPGGRRGGHAQARARRRGLPPAPRGDREGDGATRPRPARRQDPGPRG